MGAAAIILAINTASAFVIASITPGAGSASDAPAKRTETQQADIRNQFIRHVYGPARPALDSLNRQFDELKAIETK